MPFPAIAGPALTWVGTTIVAPTVTWVGTNAAAAITATAAKVTATKLVITLGSMMASYCVGKAMDWQCVDLRDLYSSMCNNIPSDFDCSALSATKTAVCGGARIAQGKLLYDGIEYLIPIKWAWGGKG